jgi:hypothetical protein
VPRSDSTAGTAVPPVSRSSSIVGPAPPAPSGTPKFPRGSKVVYREGMARGTVAKIDVRSGQATSMEMLVKPFLGDSRDLLRMCHMSRSVQLLCVACLRCPPFQPAHACARVCVCVRTRACVRMRMRLCVCVCVCGGGGWRGLRSVFEVDVAMSAMRPTRCECGCSAVQGNLRKTSGLVNLCKIPVLVNLFKTHVLVNLFKTHVLVPCERFLYLCSRLPYF